MWFLHVENSPVLVDRQIKYLMYSEAVFKKPMFPAKAFYFFYFAAFSALMPFLVLYYEGLGFSGQQIGILSAIFPLMVLVSAPLWGMIADVSKRHKLIVVLLIALSIVFGMVLNTGKSFSSLVLLFSVFAFFVAPTVPLGDTAVLALLGDQKSNYGRLRVWGAVGWGLSAPLAGILTERLGITWAFYSYALFMSLCLFSSLRLPFDSVTKDHSDGQGGGSSLRQFLTVDWIFFLCAVFISGIGLAISGSFVYLYLSELQATGLIVGLALTMATLSELPLTFYGKQLLQRFSIFSLVFAALVFVGLRLIFYSVASDTFHILLIQLLHGFCFSILWIAGIAYADANAPEGRNATAQGLFSAVLFGMGSAAGGLIGGYYYDNLGSVEMFRLLGVCILVATVVLFTIRRFWKF